MASEQSQTVVNAEGLVSRPSSYPVDETLNRLESVLRSKGVTVFTRIDHGAAAASVGLAMRPAQILIFGNPQVGTPVMNTAPTIAIDLPFKALAWEDAAGRVWLSYNSVEYLMRRHHVAESVIRPLAAIEALIVAALE